MFGEKIFITQGKTEYVDRNITVHRAPTDESVKLLNEFQEKAEKNLLLTGRIENNIINCKWYVVDGVYFDFKIVCALVINGERRDIEIICEKPSHKMNFEQFVDYVFTTLHARILQELAEFITLDGITKGNVITYVK